MFGGDLPAVPPGPMNGMAKREGDFSDKNPVWRQGSTGVLEPVWFVMRHRVIQVQVRVLLLRHDGRSLLCAGSLDI